MDRDIALRSVEKLLRVGKIDAALAQYRDVLAAHPGDHGTAIAAAALLYRAGRVEEALTQFAAVADALAAEGDIERAAEVYRRILGARPAHEHARARLFTLYLEQGELDRAREFAVTPATRRRLARALDAAGQDDAAIAILKELVAQDPSDAAAAAQIARLLVASGNAVAAAEYLTADMAGDDPDARLATAEILCRGGQYENGLELLEQTVAEYPAAVAGGAALAATVAAQAPEHGWRAIRLVADRLCAESRWADAAMALEAFVDERPDCIDALVQLVDVAVDGGLATTVARAQGRLADAYLAQGSVAEAVAVLDDLAARHPEQPAYAARLREALARAGEQDPDAALRHRLAAAALTADSGILSASAARVEPATDPTSTVVRFRAVV